MSVYLIFFFLLAGFSIDGLIYPDRKSQFYYLGSGLIILLVACRGNGFDWHSYETIYNVFHEGGERRGAEFVEYGFQWLCNLSPSYTFLVFIVGFISVFLTLKGTFPFAKLNLPVLGLLVFSSMYLLPTYMGQIRQGLAIGCVCMAVLYNYKNKKEIVLLWIGIGMLFHMTAVVALVILFTPKKQLKYWVYISTVIASIIGYGICLKLVAGLLGFNDSAAAQKAMVYAQTETESLSYSTVLLRMVTLSIVLYLNKGKNDKISYISNIYVWGIIIYLIFGFLPQLASRGAYYFAIYDMILLPFIVKSFKNEKVLFLGLYLFIVSLSLYRALVRFQDPFFSHSFIPYIQ